MLLPPVLENDQERVRALREYAILDTPKEAVFDAITELAAAICGVPIALISLVDHDRQWFKSRLGIDAPETPRNIAFCAHAIQSPQLFEVPDAHQDQRFNDNPLVTSDPMIRFYAGMVISNPDGYALGTVCVLDREPRQLTNSQRASLEQLSRVVTQLLEGRKHAMGEAVLSQVLNKSTAQIVLMDLAAKHVLFCNAIAARESQFTSTDLSAIGPEQLIAAEDLRKFKDAVTAVNQDHHARVPLRLQMHRKDGSCYPAEGCVHVCETSGRQILVLEINDISSQLAAQQALENSERRIRDLTDRLPVLIAELDAELRYCFVNGQVERVFGVAKADLLGRHIREVRGETIYADIQVQLHQALSGIRVNFEGHAVVGEHQYHYETIYVPKLDAKQQVEGLYALTLDITERKMAELAQAATEARLRAITDNLPVLICQIDREFRYAFNNATYAKWLQRPVSELTGFRMQDLHDDALIQALMPSMQRAFAGENSHFELETPFQGATHFLRGMFVPDRDASGSVTGIYGLTQDATRLRQVEQALVRLTQFDALTGLANRVRLMRSLEVAIARSEASGNKMAVIYLDVDRFKIINDTHGHQTGDQVLQEFARRLEASLRRSDLAARLAGDEFVLLLENLKGPEDAAAVAQKLLESMKSPFSISGLELTVGVSVGIALREDHEFDLTVLLARADAALYQAKSAGRNTYAFAKTP